MKKIILTGGGTAGHVTPNIALVPLLLDMSLSLDYIGSYSGIEKELIAPLNISYHPISTGKLRRYKDIRNITDPFRVIKGCYQAALLIRRLKPAVVFSKGGFVSLPVIIGAWLNRVPSILHESDISPGLANKLCTFFATRICVNFPETLELVSTKKGVLTGTPIRSELASGNAEAGLTLCGFDHSKPVIMLMGGSLGARTLNLIIREQLGELLEKYQLIHLCGRGNLDKALEGIKGYKQFEYVSSELPDLFAACELVISRAGANAISELLYIRKPNILIPLPLSASRGDQLLNAASFERKGYSYVIKEEELSSKVLFKAIQQVLENKAAYCEAMSKAPQSNGTENVLKEISRFLN